MDKNKVASDVASDVIRVLLIGRTGQGKSFTGNNMTGTNTFKVSEKHSSKSETKTCRWSGVVEIHGKKVEVVDTPGIFDTECDQTSTHKELVKSLLLSTPGFHAKAYVLKYGERITDEFKTTLDLFFDWFGHGVEKFSFLILTNCSNKADMSKYLYEDPQEKLKELMKTFDGRCTPLENTATRSQISSQIQEIFKTVDGILAKNGNCYFTNYICQLAATYAKTRGVVNLSEDSLRLIQQVDRSKMTQCQLEVFNSLDEMIETKDIEASSSGKCGGETVPVEMGNLRMFDYNTNTPIPSKSVPSKISTDFNILHLKQTEETPSRFSDETQKSTQSKGDAEDDVALGSASFGSEHCKSRKNRKIDPGSVEVEPQSQNERQSDPVEYSNCGDPEMAMKIDINEDTRQLNLFLRFLRNVGETMRKMCTIQ